MGDLAVAIARAANGGNPEPLLAAVQTLPVQPDMVDPQSDDDVGPVPGESFDDVTCAWIQGRLSDATYRRAVDAASS